MTSVVQCLKTGFSMYFILIYIEDNQFAVNSFWPKAESPIVLYEKAPCPLYLMILGTLDSGTLELT
jgi:hypothetical protein